MMQIKFSKPCTTSLGPQADAAGGRRLTHGPRTGSFYAVVGNLWPGTLTDNGDGLAFYLHSPPTHAPGLE
jgi:hypothetical protein